MRNVYVELKITDRGVTHTISAFVIAPDNAGSEQVYSEALARLLGRKSEFKISVAASEVPQVPVSGELYVNCTLPGEWGKPFEGIPIRGDAYRDGAGEWKLCTLVYDYPCQTMVCKPVKKGRRKG